MTSAQYSLIENYMLECTNDSAHDKDHIYRVLYNALVIAKEEKMWIMMCLSPIVCCMISPEKSSLKTL